LHSVDGADSPIAAEIRQGQVADAPIVVQSDEVVVAFFSDQSLANNQQRAEDLDIASDADDQDAESEEAEDSAPVGEAAGLNSNSEGDAVKRQAAAAEREAVERKRQAAEQQSEYRTAADASTQRKIPKFKAGGSTAKRKATQEPQPKHTRPNSKAQRSEQVAASARMETANCNPEDAETVSVESSSPIPKPAVQANRFAFITQHL